MSMAQGDRISRYFTAAQTDRARSQSSEQAAPYSEVVTRSNRTGSYWRFIPAGRAVGRIRRKGLLPGSICRPGMTTSFKHPAATSPGLRHLSVFEKRFHDE